ncbi:MAG: acyl-CoA dehydrogenase family protein, partial [Pseudoclavibacter sp.]
MTTLTPVAPPTTDDIVRIAEGLIPTLRERAVEVDRNRRIPDETYRELIHSGLWRILKPTKYGGYELSEADHAKVAVRLAEGCASTAWVWSILSSDNMAICSFPEAAQEEIWGQNPDATL